MKISVSNYQDQINKIDVSKLPELLKQGYDNTKEALDAGLSMEDAFDVEPEAFGLYFDNLGKWIESNQKKEPAKKEPKNYAGRKVEIRKSPGRSKKYFVWDMHTTKMFANEQFDSIAAAKSFIAQNEMVLVKEPDEAKKPASKTKAKRSPAKKKVQAFHRTGKFYDSMPIELKFCRKYLLLNGKKIRKDTTLLNFIRQIEKENAEGNFSVKDGDFGKEVSYIYNELYKLYNDKDTANAFTFHLDDNDNKMLKRLDYLKDMTHINYSVIYVKRFLNLAGNETIAKAKRLLKEMENATTSGKIREDHPLHDRISFIMRKLKAYVNGGQKPSLKPSELQGLQGIVASKKKA